MLESEKTPPPTHQNTDSNEEIIDEIDKAARQMKQIVCDVNDALAVDDKWLDEIGTLIEENKKLLNRGQVMMDDQSHLLWKRGTVEFLMCILVAFIALGMTFFITRSVMWMAMFLCLVGGVVGVIIIRRIVRFFF
jgi:hypothetical protein